LQVFLGSNALMFLFLVTTVEERRFAGEVLRENERRLAGNLAITKIIAESPSLAEATPRILRKIGETFGWEAGDIWTMNAEATALSCLTVWHAPNTKVDRFESTSQSESLAPGVGLPGVVWTSLKPKWIPDVKKDVSLLRGAIATAEGIHSAVAFPILSEEKIFGVMEFFSHEIREPDDALLQMFSSIGSQLGQFMERKQAEEAFRQSEEQLRLALEAANMGSWEYDLQTAVVKWSSGLEAIHGLAEGSFGGTFDDYQKDMHPEDHQRVMETLARTLEDGAEHDIEYRIIKPDGAVRWVEGKGQLIRDGSGKATHLTGVCMDITERKRAEEEREQLLRREHAARAEAELANRTKDEFLAIVSHELRTPLNAIVGWAGMLRGGKLVGDQVSQAVAVIDRNARSQAQLIEDILDVSRIVSSKLRLDLRPVQLQDVIQAAVDSIQLAANAKNLRLQVETDSKVRPVLGDPARLEQIVWNLLSNAVKFTPAEGAIEVCLISNDSQAQIIVRDTGKGIDTEFLPHVFDRFRQADGSRTRRQGGLGLGLAIVHQLVELHSGTVEAFSAGEGKGATFIVKLPYMSLGAETSVSEHAAQTKLNDAIPEIVGVRILIVEDNPDTRQMLSFLLRSRGAEVISVSSVREAMTVLNGAETIPEILVSDLGMADEDGYDLIKKLRARRPEDGGNIPAIAVTAYAGSEELERALKAGYQTVLTKPVNLDELLKTIALRLNSKNLSQHQS